MVHIVKTMVFSLIRYGCESRTIKKAECQTIDAFYLFIYFLLYNTVLVLPYIDMNPPQIVHEFPTLSPPPTTLPISSLWVIPVHQPKHPVSCIELGLVIHFIYDIIHVSIPFSKSSHPLPLQQSPKVCSIYLCLFCCLTYRVIVTIFLNSIYMH